MKRTTTTRAITPNTLTQRGVPGFDAPASVALTSWSRSCLAMVARFARAAASCFAAKYKTVCLYSYRLSRKCTRSTLLAMPRLWNETVDAHRRVVTEAILDTTAALVAEHGLRSVTMSQIAHETGIGRATLYKYFPSVEAILFAWHQRQIAAHLAYLAEVRDEASDAAGRLEGVLEAYALISRESHADHDSELTEFLHRDDQPQVADTRHQLQAMIRDLLAEGAASGDVRDDVGADELATYCLHALAAARSLPSKAAVRRLVAVTLAGMRPLGRTGHARGRSSSTPG
jgi:AcrR family transcriptional regulator